MSEVSVVIPAYDQPGMLAETLESVDAQTLRPTEIVVIDDCSSQSLELVTEFSPDLPVRFVRNERNLGPAGSVVRGIRESRCELVSVLNHDDVWEPRFLERMTGALAAHPRAGFAFCDHGIMAAGGAHDEARSRAQSERFGRARLRGGVLDGESLCRAALLEKAVAASSFALVRRWALDLALIESGGDMWDYFLAVGACRLAGVAVYVAERLGWYRLSPTMLTTTWADPRKQVEMARAQTAVLVFALRSERFKPIGGAVRMRLLVTMRHALAAAVRTRRPASVPRVCARVLAGAREGAMLLGGERAGEARLPSGPRPGLSGKA